MPAPIYLGMVCRTLVKITLRLLNDDSCESTELFLELTLYVVSGE